MLEGVKPVPLGGFSSSCSSPETFSEQFSTNYGSAAHLRTEKELYALILDGMGQLPLSCGA